MREDYVLITPRLGLRPFVADDVDDLHAILGDEETMRYYPAPFSREQCEDWIRRARESYASVGFGLWAVEDRSTGEFLGDCGPAIRTVEGREEPEIGWHTKRSRWNQGIATEAATACRDHAFGPLGLERVIALVRPENVASGRVAQKIGMTVDREIDYHGLRHYVYAVSRPG
ncbi:MAG TPA: GNAT family N-acetyltransferase [Actinomycetota bacterium]